MSDNQEESEKNPDSSIEVGKKVHARNEQGTPICGAKLKGGRICRDTHIMPNGRCRRHGGKMPSGPGHPNYRHGRSSKMLPDAVAARYREAYDDKELLEIRGDVALFAARQTELTGRIDTGEAGYLWAKLREAWADLQTSQNDAKRAAETGNDAALAIAREKSAAALTAVGNMIQRGAANEAVWDEILTTTERLVKVKEAEMRRLDRLNQMMTLEQVILIFGQMHAAIAASVRRRVPEELAGMVLMDVGNKLREWLACGQFSSGAVSDMNKVAGRLDPSIPTLGEPEAETIEGTAAPASKPAPAPTPDSPGDVGDLI